MLVCDMESNPTRQQTYIQLALGNLKALGIQAKLVPKNTETDG